MAKYCEPGYKTHDGPNAVSPKGHKSSTQILEEENGKVRKRPGARTQDHPAISGKY